MNDRYADHAAGLASPATRGFAAEPAQQDLPEVTRALYVGRGGDLVLLPAEGPELVFRNVPDGTLLPVRARRVLPATTAGFVLGLC